MFEEGLLSDQLDHNQLSVRAFDMLAVRIIKA
jgi:hypothetical protein